MLCRICNIKKVSSTGFTFQWQISFTEPNIWMWLGFNEKENKCFFISEKIPCNYKNFIWYINDSIIRPWYGNICISSKEHSLILVNPLFERINNLYIIIKSLHKEYSFFHFIKIMNFIPVPQTFKFILVNFEKFEIETISLI